jgi:hypothetical protein
VVVVTFYHLCFRLEKELSEIQSNDVFVKLERLDHVPSLMSDDNQPLSKSVTSLPATITKKPVKRSRRNMKTGNEGESTKSSTESVPGVYA